MDSETLVRFKRKYVVATKPHQGLGTPCWLWTGAMRNGGYGYMRVRKDPDLPISGGKNSRAISAHILMYEHVNGPILEGLELDHLCRVHNCVNPDHLEAVTHAENVKRGEAGLHNPEKTHCPNGHAYTAENTLIINDPRGAHRRCKKCHADYECKRRQRLRKKR